MRLPTNTGYSIAAVMKRQKVMRLLSQRPMYLIEIAAALGVGLPYAGFVVRTMLAAGQIETVGNARKLGRTDLHPRQLCYGLKQKAEHQAPVLEFKPLKRDPFAAMKLAELTRR